MPRPKFITGEIYLWAPKHPQLLCEGLTEMKSVSGAWGTDFHPPWGHCPPHTPTNGWWAMLPWPACFFFPFREDGPVLAASQYFLRRRKMLWFLVFLGYATCHVHRLSCLSLLSAWWTPIPLYTAASASPMEGLFSFSRWTMLLFFLPLLTLTAFFPHHTLSGSNSSSSTY